MVSEFGVRGHLCPVAFLRPVVVELYVIMVGNAKTDWSMVPRAHTPSLREAEAGGFL